MMSKRSDVGGIGRRTPLRVLNDRGRSGVVVVFVKQRTDHHVADAPTSWTGAALNAVFVESKACFITSRGRRRVLFND